MRYALAILTLVLTTGSHAAAQSKLPTDPHLFLERSYIAPGNPLGKSLVFEGDAATHLFLFNRMTWNWSHEGGWAFAMPVSTIITARMSTSSSSPVRTPSYRIRPIWLQAFKLTPYDPKRPGFRLVGFGVGAMHYSNGQEGCTYRGYVRDTTMAGRPCVITNAPLAARFEGNPVNGDFSTTFFPIAGYWRAGKLRGNLQVASQHSASLELQIHPLAMKPGGLDRELAMQYGRHQLNGTYEYEWHTSTRGEGMRRLSTRGVLRTPQDSGAWWGFGSLEYSRVWDSRQGFGYFARATFGGDYYNIHFNEKHYPLFTFGVIWDQSRIDYYNHLGGSRGIGRP